jgi:vanadium-dependent haloperoxidase-like protein
MRLTRLHPVRVHPFRNRAIAAAFLTAALFAANLSEIGAAAHPPTPAADPAVITFWNETAVATIVTDAGKANAEAFLWYAFEQAAVYNAVVGITGRYELYNWNTRGPKWASPEAAAAAAAHRVLSTYFPASQTRLDTALADSLLQIPDGHAKEQGVRYGEKAADRIIELRVDDGRFADVPFDVPLEPGVWRPTPPGFAPFFDPWLSQVRPLLLTSPSQFRPSEPPALTSDTYTEEFQEVMDYGVATDSLRTPEQTETAFFFSDIGIGPLQASLRDLVTRRHMDISDAARLFAAVDMSLADAIGAIWDSKFHFGFWRPVTAIQLADDDGNPETDGDADWLPLIATPPYPDYASGLSGVIGALSRTLSRLLGDGRVDLNITSAAAGLPGPPLTRHYEFAADLNRDVVDARVWSGIHFRTADVVGSAIGTQVGDWAMDHYFQPRDGHHAGTDSVVAWNANAGDASVAACFIGGYAPQEARMYAMMHVAIHDALNGIVRRSRPYAVALHAARGTSPDAAVAAAARDVLVAVLGSFSFFLPAECINAGVASVEADYVAALDAIPDGMAKTQGIALGQDAAEATLALRASDGYDTPPVDPNYQEGTAPGEYRYTPGTPFAFAPGLGEDLTPFALTEGSQFRPGPPFRLTSRRYAADVNEVQRLGGDDVTTPSDRTDEQTEIALFWVESSPLMWNRIARTVSMAEELDRWENARLFGLLNIGLIDGYIGSFEAKYHYRFWRPVTAIRLADIDDNPATTADPTWTPLLENPPVPDYDSGHATEGGVAAQVLSRFFHTNSMSFSLCSFTLPEGERCSDGSPTLRHFTRFSQAMYENAVSRIYVGFHFRDAVKTGIRHGRTIGNWTVNHVLRPVWWR